jgi:hypothetical protein
MRLKGRTSGLPGLRSELAGLAVLGEILKFA